MTCICTYDVQSMPTMLNNVVLSTELYYIWRKHANLFSVTVEAKNMADFCRIWRHSTPFLWQRLKVVTASQAQFWARGSSHTPLDLLKVIFCSKFYLILSMGMIFMDCIWFFTIYPKMCKLFKIFLALERDKELIKPWKCDQLWYFRGEGNRTNYDVSYETGISMKTLVSFFQVYCSHV